MWMSLSGPNRITKNLSRAVGWASSLVSTNCLCFCSPSDAQSEEWKGTPQRQRTSTAPVFPGSPVNFTDDRQTELMDDMVTFSLFGNQCIPSSLSPLMVMGMERNAFCLYDLLFTAAAVLPPLESLKQWSSSINTSGLQVAFALEAWTAIWKPFFFCFFSFLFQGIYQRNIKHAAMLNPSLFCSELVSIAWQLCVAMNNIISCLFHTTPSRNGCLKTQSKSVMFV